MQNKIIAISINKRAEEIIHKQSELISFARELAARFPQYKHIRWENAALVPWQEIIRKPDVVDESAPKDTIDETFGSNENRWNYWSNQLDVRRNVLELVAKYLEGNSSPKIIKKHLIESHIQLILGINQNTPYFPPTFISMGLTNRRDLLKSMASSLGLTNVGISLFHKQIKVIVEKLKDGDKSVDSIKNQLYELQRLVIVPEYLKECTSSFAFDFGNNSYSMNHLNAFLRLFGNQGILHDGIDFALLSNRITPTEAYGYFINVLLFNGKYEH